MSPRTLLTLFALGALALGCASEKPNEETDNTDLRSVAVPGEAATNAGGIKQQTCGGAFDAPCPSTHFCDSTSCGFGVCQPRPLTCARYELPVCGCDGVTWDSGCAANAAGVDVSYAGACLVPPYIPSAAPEAPSPIQP